MVPPTKVWKLLETVGSKDVYQFLGMSPDNSLEELRAAADRRHTSLHNQSSRNPITRAGEELAKLCESHIFKNARNKNAYDKESEKRDPNAKAAAGAERKAALTAVFSTVGGYIVKYAGVISAIGIPIMLLGVLLQRIVPIVLQLGALVFLCGFTGFLYKGPRKRIKDASLAGAILVVPGIFAETSNSFLAGLMLDFRLLGGTVLLSGFASILFKDALHVKIMDTIRPIVEWWMTKTARWHVLLRLGSAGFGVGVLLLVITSGVGVLAGTSGGLYLTLSTATKASFQGGVILVMAGTVWRLIMRQREVVQCQSCQAQMTRKEFGGTLFSYKRPRCPTCGSDLPPRTVE